MIEPTALGAWTLTVDAAGTTISRDLLTDELAFDEAWLSDRSDAGSDGGRDSGSARDPRTGFVRRYVDRVDTCSVVTPAGRVLCSTGAFVALYDLDGGLEREFSDFGQAFSFDNQVWVVRAPGTLERFVETPAGVVPAGSIDVSGFIAPTYVDANRVVTVVGTTVLEVVPDGGGIHFGSLKMERMQFPLFPGVLLADGQDALWSREACRLEPGCATRLCVVAETCDELSGDLVSVEATSAIVHQRNSRRLLLLSRPLDLRTVLHERGLFVTNDRGVRDGLRTLVVRPQVTWSTPLAMPELYEWSHLEGRNVKVGYVEAVVRRDRILFRVYLVRTPVTFTPEWLVLREGPRELRFIHR